MSLKRKEMTEYPELDYFMNESESDVVFVIEGQRLPALKALLKVKNEVFRAMFSDNWKESKEIEIKDTTFDAFKTLIQFLYCDRLVLKDNNDLELIREVCKLCDRYESSRLLTKTAEHLKTISLTFENTETITSIAVEFHFEGVLDNVTAFLDTNFQTLLYKDVKDLSNLNNSTHNQVMKVLIDRYKKLEKKLRDIRRGRCPQCKVINVLWDLEPRSHNTCVGCKHSFWVDYFEI